MLKFTHTKDISEKVGEQVTIQGFAHAVRAQSKIVFVVVRDITGTIQTVTPSNSSAFETAQNLSTESVVRITGLVKEEKNAPGGVEVAVETIQVLSVAAPELPIPVVTKKGGEDTDQAIRLDWRWIDLRKPEKALIFKVWTTLEQAFRTYFINNGYIEIHSPKTIVTSTESGSELFEIKYFDKKAYLAQSPQLYKQMGIASGFERVFEVGPVFRANPSFTSRHDTEFTMYDVELAYVDSQHDIMDEEEKMMVFIMQAIRDKHKDDIKKYYNLDVEVPKMPFPRLTLKEVKEILAKLGVPNERGDDLSPEEERAIADYVKEKDGCDFVFIHEFPASVRAFYSMRSEEDPTISKSFDLLYRGLEITSGAQREHRYEKLKEQIEEKGFDLKPFETYLNFFKYGCPPHGGFAPGPTRILMKLLEIDNVREVTYLYRGPNRLTP